MLTLEITTRDAIWLASELSPSGVSDFSLGKAHIMGNGIQTVLKKDCQNFLRAA
jgi:hypothetical protein